MNSKYLWIGIIIALLVLLFNTYLSCQNKNLETLENMNIDWKSGLSVTHYYDCGGQSCDSSFMKNYDDSKFIAGKGYTVLDPKDFGGSVYGEKMWIYGAASDELAEQMGDNIKDLGVISPYDEAASSGGVAPSVGCGQSILIKNPNAKNKHWTALVMRRSRCPPSSPGCNGDPHMDLMIPGFDFSGASGKNRCGRPGTGMTQEQSELCGGNNGKSPAECDKCDQLPGNHAKGCQLFTDWGWPTGDPQCDYAFVKTPQIFIDYTKLIQLGGKYADDPEDN